MDINLFHTTRCEEIYKIEHSEVVVSMVAQWHGCNKYVQILCHNTALHRAKSDTMSLTVASPSAYFNPHSKFTHSHLPVSIQLEPRGRSAPDEGHTSGSTDAMPLDEDDIDLGPFTFKLYKLASLLDPKDLHSLEAIGGVEALLHGLGTHPTQGLWVSTHDYGDDRSSDGRPGAGAGASQRHDQPSATKQDMLKSKGILPGDDRGDNGDPFHMTPQERK